MAFDRIQWGIQMRRFWVWRSCKHLFIEKTITVSIPLISICISGHLSSSKQSSYNSWKYKIVQALLVMCRGMKSIKTVPPPWQSNFGCSKKNRCYCSTQILGYKCKATALRTPHQPLWNNNNLPNQRSSKYKTLQNFQLNIGPCKTQEIKQSPRDKH